MADTHLKLTWLHEALLALDRSFDNTAWTTLLGQVRDMLEAHAEEIESSGGVVMLENGGVGQQLRQALDILGSMLARLQARPEGSRLEDAAAGPE